MLSVNSGLTVHSMEELIFLNSSLYFSIRCEGSLLSFLKNNLGKSPQSLIVFVSLICSTQKNKLSVWEVPSKIFIPQESTNLEDYLKKDFGKEGNSQPYILILGGTMLKPQQTFVIIEHRALEQTSLIKAVDVCFKAFYVFDLQYPEKCSGVWEFISAIVYMIWP